MEVVHTRCAGLDVSKRRRKIRVQGAGRCKTRSTVTTWGSMTTDILRLRGHLLAEKVTCVVMEATSEYWKPFYYLLEDSLPVMLVNARGPGTCRDARPISRRGVAGPASRARAVAGSFVPPRRRSGNCGI